jgi:hypothetical protein
LFYPIVTEVRGFYMYPTKGVRLRGRWGGCAMDIGQLAMGVTPSWKNVWV